MKAPLLKATLQKGLEGDTRYAGGGMNRVAAGVYCNPVAKLFGLYNPTQGVALMKSLVK